MSYSSQIFLVAMVEDGWLGELSHVELKTVLTLACDAKRTGEACTGMDRLAGKTFSSRANVQRALKKLVELQAVEVVEAGGGPGRLTRRGIILQNSSKSPRVAKLAETGRASVTAEARSSVQTGGSNVEELAAIRRSDGERSRRIYQEHIARKPSKRDGLYQDETVAEELLI